MCLATRFIRAAVVLSLASLALVGIAPPASAYVDADANRIDDRIDAIAANGWNFAFENQDPTRRMRIGVENPGDIVYAIYVGYDHRPNAADEALLSATGVSMVWPFQNIPYIESRATWAQVQLIATLPGVTAVEAVPVDYALNHYGSRVVRSRDSRGLTKADNGVLFPSVREQLGLDGEGIVIAILDTGVNDETDTANPGYPGHESLKGKFLGGGEFWCGQPACSTPANGSANPQDHGGDASSYHGTHVAGTAMGTGGAGGFFAGVAPGARLVDCKVLSDAGASVGGSTRGVDWVISNRNTLWAGLSPGSIWQGIDVVNMSLGSTECTGGSGTSTGSGASSAAINAAVDAGIVMVIATGNDNSVDCIASPAAADKSIAVGASLHAKTLDRSDDAVTNFSNEGPRDDDGDADHLDEMKPSVVAPGAGIISASGDPTTDGTAYSQLSGTSMAAPHVAGCAALVLQANPSLSPMQVRAILQHTAEHNVPTTKASGDRGQDPYGVDANYDPSCGWGLVDVYAAVKEALNSTSGVQVTQIRAVPVVPSARIDVTWITQREYPFLGFDLHRAPDVGGAPGAYVKLNTLPIAPTGDPVIEGDDNRTPYVYQDTDPALTVGQAYWYRVDWIDLTATAHAEPAVSVEYGQLARVATAYYSLVHNAADNDLEVRIGADRDYSPGSLGQADFEVLGPGETQQDSARVILPGEVPANTGTSTVGTVEHFWSVGFNQGDGAETHLPPSQSRPWFLAVRDGGFVNRTGRVTGFSLFVNDFPGSPGGVTYATDHVPMPQPMVEGGAVPVTLWIPEPRVTPVLVAMFDASGDPDGVRVRVVLGTGGAGYSATFYRSTESEFASRERIHDEALAFESEALTFVDRTASPGVTYYYWIQIHEPDGRSFMNGPVSGRIESRVATTWARPPAPNPVRRSAIIEYAVGHDVANSGTVDVSLQLVDLQGRVARTLARGPRSAGEYRVSWDASDDRGQRVAPGVYFLRLRAGTVAEQTKVMVMD